MQRRSNIGGIVFALLAWGASADATSVQAQVLEPWQNAPQPPAGRQVVPFMEGWYDNGDGTYTISFGYLNRNPTTTVEIPLGERNYIEPAQYDGVQPTTFLPSRKRGWFAITIPASARDQDIWWNITDEDGQVYKVPGRARAAAYQLDWNARPHGSVTPVTWFDSERDAGQGPEGARASQPVTASVGQPVELSVNARDPSVRDPQDRRFAEPLDVRVVWSKYQGPEGEVTFARHESTPEPASPAGGRGRAPGPDVVTLDGVAGTARVSATFSAPGEYLMLAQVDNWRSPDSSAGDQCCWTNAYQRVIVTP
jgi:hypothetical protein